MTTQTRSQTELQLVFDPASRLGHVSLTVADLGRQIAFYRKYLVDHRSD